MSRSHGKSGAVYMEVTSGGSAEPIAFLSSWSIDQSTDKDDVTAFGDSNRVYVSGIPDASGDFSGFYDGATAQTYKAAVDGLPRKFYLYPNTASATDYFYGTILPDFKANADVGSAAKISASWNAASAIRRAGY